MLNFRSYANLTNVIIPNGVTLSPTFKSTFSNMNKLTHVEFPYAKVDNMAYMFAYCQNLKAEPCCGDNTTNLFRAYQHCYNLTGSPVCGPNVTNMYMAYERCSNLTGSPTCGDKVVDMCRAYVDCYNLTGEPSCGNNVRKMDVAYMNCHNLTGHPICGKNVTNMMYAYQNCQNLNSNAYFYSSSINNAYGCFQGWQNTKYLNIYLPANSISLNTIIATNGYSHIIGDAIYLNEDIANNRYYNTQHNIYIYPVENVAAARTANGDD